MKLEHTIIQSDTLNTGASGALLPLAALCCLVVALVGMGLKLPWFRRQMRLGNMAHVTAAASAQREVTASVTSMPTQGVFRRLSFESLPISPPPLPLRTESVRPQSVPQLPSVKAKQIRPNSQAPPAVKAKAKPISISPPPPKMKANPLVVVPPPPKLKSAPPSRRNPNAIAFAATSAATIPVKSNQGQVVEAANPMHQVMDNNNEDEHNGFLATPHNGTAIMPVSRSPKLATKKDPKTRKAVKEKKKSPFFAKMSPKVVKPPPPSPPISSPPPPQIPVVTRTRYSSASEEEDNDGNFTFTLPDSPEPMSVQHSFLRMGGGGGGDSDECDA